MSGSAPPPAGDQGWARVQDLVTRVLAPAGVLTAVLYYFGYVREQAFFAHFGVDLGSVGFSTTDYLVRSAGTVFGPLATLLVAALGALAVHHALLYALTRVPPRRQRLAWSVAALGALALLGFGVIGLARRGDPLLHPVLAPAALGAGAILLEYVISTALAARLVPPTWVSVLARTRVQRVALAVGLALVALFWGTANVAQQRGIAAARAIERALPVQPQAVVYSRERLFITGPGVDVEELDDGDGGPTFRYNGLRPLAHAGGRWFLLPAGWTRSNGATVVLLPDTAAGVRVDLAPGGSAG